MRLSRVGWFIECGKHILTVYDQKGENLLQELQKYGSYDCCYSEVNVCK